MYAGSQFNWYDKSSIATAAAPEDINPKVRYFCLITSDKGTEDLTTLAGTDWLNMYGSTPSFEKHGQPLLQATNIINAGGVCVTKRLVADDATLANVAVVAKISTEAREKVDANGNPLYIDPSSGKETTDSGDGSNSRVTYDAVVISHSLISIEGAKSYDEVVEKVKDATDASSNVYPLYVIADNGRGSSVKKVALNPEYAVSKNGSYMVYSANVIEGTKVTDQAKFTIDPSIVAANKSYSLSEYTFNSVKCATLESNVEAYIAALAKATGYGADYLLTQDFLFGKTLKGNNIAGIEFDEASVDITATYGIELQNGDNGNFGDAPFGTEQYIAAASKYMSDDNDIIYDTTVCSCDVVFDANYPDPVKAAIGRFVDNRQDMFFFRDLGLDITTYEALYNKLYDSECPASKFNGVYCTSYDVYDPITKKPIQVTMLYNMAPLIIDFFAGGRNRPLCGPSNGMVINDYIPGTVRFSPRITPVVNQKSLLEDIKVNYAIRTDASTDELTIETCYTSQEAYTQASFINNILAIQQVVKAIRAYSPKVRYQFYTTSDFSDYAKTIEENVLDGFKSGFNTLRLVYTQDDLMAERKIFKAALEVSCGTFIQTEIYDVFIINAEN